MKSNQPKSTISPERLFRIQPQSRRIEITLGYACNNRCLFCTEYSNRHSAEVQQAVAQLTTEKVKNILQENRKRGADHITFLGGEPTIRRDFLELVRFSRHELGYKTVFLTSNGRMLKNPKYAEALIKSGLTHLCLSLHGHNAQLHDATVCVDGAFEQVTQAMRNLRSMNFDFQLTSVINKLNYQELHELLEYQLEWKPTRIIWAYVRPSGRALESIDEIVPLYTDVREPLCKALELADERKATLTVANMPLCMLPSHEKYSDELYWNEDALRREVNKPGSNDGTKLIVTSGHGKLKRPSCNNCSLVMHCDGVPVEYVKRRGFLEFEPVEGELVKNISNLRDETLRKED